MESNTPYGMSIRVSGSFSDARERVISSLKEQGFGLLTEIDVAETLRQKLGKEMEPYSILGMCNPNLASRAVDVEPEVGLLLPCNVLVRQQGGAVTVSAQDPSIMMEVAGNPRLKDVATEAKEKLTAGLKLLESA